MTAWRRQEYTKRVIDGLKKCIGFEEYTILPIIEPGYPEVLKAFDGLSNCQIVVNDSVSDCSRNTLKALERGFNISDFVIHMEDDTVPGTDSLRYFEWVYRTYKDNKEVFTATAYNRIKDINHQDYFTVYKRRWFTPWMWCTWIDRFEEMKREWDFNAWDIHLIHMTKRHYCQILPVLSRSQNIGEYFGTNNCPDVWMRSQYNSVWIDGMKNISFDNLAYSETINIPSGDDTENLVTHSHHQAMMTIPHIKPKIGEGITAVHSNGQVAMSIPSTKPKIGREKSNISFNYQIIIPIQRATASTCYNHRAIMAVPHIEPKIGNKIV